MDVREAVKDMANYGSIVTYFKSMETIGPEDMVLLVDTIDSMSEEIFEHYKALCELCKKELQRVRRICREQQELSFLDETEKRQVAYAVTKACDMGILLTEKYADMAKALGSSL